MKCLVCDEAWYSGRRREVVRGRRRYEVAVCGRCTDDGYLLSQEGDAISIEAPDGKVFEVDPARTKESTRTAKTKKSRVADHPPLPGTEGLFLPPGQKKVKREKTLPAESLRDGERKERRHG